MKKSLALLSLLCFITAKSTAQEKFDSLVTLNISQNGEVYKNINTGGFGLPQMTQLDLNSDGYKDLLVMDRASYPRTAKVFINNGQTGPQAFFEYDQTFEKNIPDLDAFIYSVDLNCDNIPDIATRGFKGLMYHYGAYDSDGRWYAADSEFPVYHYTNSVGTQDSLEIYIPVNGDIPLVIDLDDDGDYDVLSFAVVSPGIIFYKNYQVEEGLPCNTNRLRAESNCFDMLRRADSVWHYDYSCKQGGKTTHALAVMMSQIDIDGDGDIDIASGSNNTSVVNVLYNNGSSTMHNFNSQDTLLETSNGYLIKTDSGAFANFIDYNNDGKLDLALTNLLYSTTDHHNFIPYQNTSSSGVTLQEDPTSFFHNFTFDLGSTSRPVLYDQDHDGDQDLFIAVDKSIYGTHYMGSHIYYFRNHGTDLAPDFRLADDDFMGLSSSGLMALHPSFGDIDNDGDVDLVLGHRTGIAYMLNSQPHPLPPNYSSLYTSFPAVDSAKSQYTYRPFYYYTPFLYDVDGDGYEDIVSGEQYGNLFYFKNGGNTGTVQFTFENVALGQVDVSGDNDPNYQQGASFEGYSVPWIGVMDSTDSVRLLIGNTYGQIYKYEMGDQLSSFWMRDTSITGEVHTLSRSAPTAAKLGGSDFATIISGSSLGGLICTSLSVEDTSSTLSYEGYRDVSLHPNPSEGVFYIAGLDDHKKYSYQVSDILGRVRLTGKLREHKLVLPGQSGQVYLLLLRDSSGQSAYFKIQIK